MRYLLVEGTLQKPADTYFFYHAFPLQSAALSAITREYCILTISINDNIQTFKNYYESEQKRTDLNVRLSTTPEFQGYKNYNESQGIVATYMPERWVDGIE